MIKVRTVGWRAREEARERTVKGTEFCFRGGGEKTGEGDRERGP